MEPSYHERIHKTAALFIRDRRREGPLTSLIIPDIEYVCKGYGKNCYLNPNKESNTLRVSLYQLPDFLGNNADSIWIERSTGAPLNVTWDKMSKSKLNGVDPSEVVRRYGIELVRLTLLANVGPHRPRKWQEDGVKEDALSRLRSPSNEYTKTLTADNPCVAKLHCPSTVRPRDSGVDQGWADAQGVGPRAQGQSVR
ncbi:hypothetical protein AHF37_01945 [Paragonimus kellicotti]|nr:hypothetical protein AHF37_01945 [Paragonimus kellicotti]